MGSLYSVETYNGKLKLIHTEIVDKNEKHKDDNMLKEDE